MTDLTWTDQPPSEPGWYFKQMKDSEASVVYVKTPNDYRRVHYMKWAGPIPEPKED